MKGTNWCGAGNFAFYYDDLGWAWSTDKCCRQHDYCPDTISAWETKHGLTNHGFYTRLSCECDVRFHRCLNAIVSDTAVDIGHIYFNMLNTKCFRNDFPMVGCKRRGGWFDSKCLEPEYDKTREKLYQWFDVPEF